jgi:Bacterial toxin 4
MTLEQARAHGYTEAGTREAPPPTGAYSVTRPTEGDPRVVIRAWIGGRQARAGLEREMRSAAEYGIDQLTGWQRAHSTAPSLGIESGEAIRLAPELVNQALQNRGIEAFLRFLRDQAAAQGERLHLQTETRTQTGTLRLSSIHYLVERQEGQRMITLFEVAIEVREDGSARAGVRLEGSDEYTFGPWLEP